MPAKPTTSPSASAGFTLVEVLMAMLIMTVGLLGLLQSINVAYQHNLGNRLREQALALGEEQMIQLRRQAGTEATFSNMTTAVRTVAGASKRFTVTRECEEIGGSAARTRRLKVTVGWSLKNQNLTHVVYSLKKL